MSAAVYVPPTNAVPVELNVTRVLDLALRAFVAALLPLRAFSTVISGDILRGAKTVEVPYFPAETAASTNFNAANGDCYDFGNTAVQKKEVTINRRKYQPWGRTSEEIMNNAFLANLQFAEQKGRKLAADVLADILSIITAGNYPANKIIGLPADFDLDDCLDIREACNTAKMPRVGRSMILEDIYETPILKDLKPYNLSGDGANRALREGEVGRIAGFDEYATQVLPTANNLVGAALLPSAVLVAMRPLEPLPSVQAMLQTYEVVTDPETGLSMTYKVWGDPNCDVEKSVIEANYGFAVGEPAALLRLLSA